MRQKPLAPGAITADTHEQKTDPHTQYVKFTDGGTAGGFVRMVMVSGITYALPDDLSSGGTGVFLKKGAGPAGQPIWVELVAADLPEAWDDLRIEPVARTTGANAPTFEKWLDDAAGTSRGVYLYSFDDVAAGSEKEVFFTMQMPHAWKLGTDIALHVHWIGNVDDTTAAPRWGLEYAWKDIGQVFGDTTIVYSTGENIDASGSPDADITAFKHYISEFADLSPGATADGLSSILIGRIWRNSSAAGDTYDAIGNKCGLLYIDAHYQIDALGSLSEYSKT